MGNLRVAWRGLRLSLHVLLGLVLTVVLSRKDKATGEYRHNRKIVSWWLRRVCTILNVQQNVFGERPKPPALLVSNHISWLDITVLGGLVETSFLSKAEVRDWPIVGWLAAAAETLFIKRGGGEAGGITEQIAQRMNRQQLLVLFPEGTTGEGKEIRKFFSRLFGSVVEAEKPSPVVPILLRYHQSGEHDAIAPFVGEQSLGENLLGLMRRPKTQVEIHFLDALQLPMGSRKEVANAARDAMVSCLEARSANPTDATAST